MTVLSDVFLCRTEKQNSTNMKKSIVALGLLILISAGVNAQTKETHPSLAISKDVQKLQFRNTEFTPAILTTTTALPSSKGIAQIQNNRTEIKGKVAMTGTPSWVISKGVARKQYEQSK